MTSVPKVTLACLSFKMPSIESTAALCHKSRVTQKNSGLRSKFVEEVEKTNTTLRLIWKTIWRLTKLREVTEKTNCK